MGQNFLIYASLDIILDRGEMWASGVSTASKNMSKLGLTAEKIDIESNFPPEQKADQECEAIRHCNHLWLFFCSVCNGRSLTTLISFVVIFWGNVALNVDFLSRQTEFGHIFWCWWKAWYSPFTSIQSYVQSRSGEKVASSQKKLCLFSLRVQDPETEFRNLLNSYGNTLMHSSGALADVIRTTRHTTAHTIKDSPR